MQPRDGHIAQETSRSRVKLVLTCHFSREGSGLHHLPPALFRANVQ